MRRYAGWITGGALAVVLLAALVFIVWQRSAKVPAPAPVAASVMALPGDAYIDQTARAYMAAIIAGEPRDIEHLRLAVVDAEVVRAETLGRFASLPAKSLRVVAVHDERAISGRGNGQPATNWTAIVTIGVTRASQVETFGVELAGSFSSHGTVDSSRAEASAR